MLTQLFTSEGGKHNRPLARFCLWFLEPQLAVQFLQRMANVNLAGLNVHILPAEPEEFTLTHSACDREHKQRGESVPGGGIEESRCLFGRNSRDGPSDHLWSLDVPCGIESLELPGDGPFQRAMQDSVYQFACPGRHLGPLQVGV